MKGLPNNNPDGLIVLSRCKAICNTQFRSFRHKRKSFRPIWLLCAGALSLFFSNIACAQTAVEAWVQRYSFDNIEASSDQANKVVTDGAGNIIVAGFADNCITGRDMFIVKYSGAGIPLWTNRYNGSANDDDNVQALAVDGNGNVFITGSSIGNGSSADYVTIKYSGEGMPLWTNRYNGPGNGIDQAKAMGIDNSGNVFVTGGSTDDYATIAYAGAGVPLWTNRYSSIEAGGIDAALALAVDVNGNVFVTGGSGDDYSGHYATIAYSGAGMPLWTNLYNHNGVGSGNDEAVAIVVSGSGNVIVTGTSSDNNTYADYATIAYSGAGVPLWTNRYGVYGHEQAHALAVDSSGNVFVTGSSISDYATIAYSAAGVPMWTNRYAGPANSYDYANAVVVDGNGNVFVTGNALGITSSNDYVTIAYSGAGTPLWTNSYNGPGNGDDQAHSIVVDGSGNLIVTGHSQSTSDDGSEDFVTISYSGAGVPLWTNRCNGGSGNSDDGANAVAVDNNGNVFVTGRSVGNGSLNDYATIAYSGAGVPLWTNRYNGPGNSYDHANAVGVDGSGNVFVTGDSIDSGSTYDYATIAYSGAGVPMWTNRYNGPANIWDHAHALAVDGNGNVFVTGQSIGSGSLDDFATIAYSGVGVPLWTNRYNGPGNNYDYGRAVAVGGSGNVFVSGSSVGSGSSSDYATIAYSGAGAPLWTNRYNGPANNADDAGSVAVDSNGNVFVTGGSGGDCATIAYSAAGVPLWTNRYNGVANSADVGRSVAVDSNGNVFVTGYSGSGSSSDYATIAYSGAGVPLWTNRYNGGVHNYANAIAVDTAGNVYVTGYSYGSGYHFDYATIAYSGAGVPLWTNRYDGPASGNDTQQRKSLALAPDGVVVAGYSDGNFSSRMTDDYAVVKYANAIAPTLLASGSVRLAYRGNVGASYILDRTFSLSPPITWISQETNPAGASGILVFTNNAVSATNNFWRIRFAP